MGPSRSLIILLVGFIASIFTIVIGFEHFTDSASPDGRIGIGVLSFFVLLFLVYAVFQEYRYSRKARYAEASTNFQNIFLQCIEDIDQTISNDNILSRLQVICDQMTIAFNMITATKCCTCVKILNQSLDEINKDNPSIEVATLVRDISSRKARTTPKGIVTHWLNANTDFYEIFKNIEAPSGKAFFENNLPKKQNYENTSFETYGRPPEIKFPLFKSTLADLTWTLPYKSTIVAPIYSEKAPEPLVGFLCVDSSSRGVFHRRYDRDIVCSIATGLYPLILIWHENNDRKYTRSMSSEKQHKQQTLPNNL